MPRVIISEPGKTPQPYRFKLERKTINIGRGSENDIVFECSSCSTHHCVMERVEGGYTLTDAGSTNGIKLDGALMDVIDLFDGMTVFVGDIPLEFSLSKEEIAILSQEEFTAHQRKKLPPIQDAPAEVEELEELEYDEDFTVQEEPHHTTSSPRAAHSPTTKSGHEGLKTLLILILMILGVAAGFSLRHYKETGQFLPTQKTQEKTTPTQKAAPSQEAPTPSAE